MMYFKALKAFLEKHTAMLIRFIWFIIFASFFVGFVLFAVIGIPAKTITEGKELSLKALGVG